MFARRLIGVSSVRLIRQRCTETETSNSTEGDNKVHFSRDGDTGNSTTLSGCVLPKDDKVFHAIGDTEELLSYIGLAREYAVDAEHDYIHKLKRIQTVLIDICTAISRFDYKEQKKIPPIHTKELEEWIEKYSKELPPVERYVIPGGGVAGASLHVARALCRKSERSVVSLVREGSLDEEILAYLNRLSDFLFTLSRLATKLDKRTESIYIPQSNEKMQMP